MPNFVIFDTAAGFLQWSGKAASQADAFRAFAADVGVTFEPADEEDAGAMSGDFPQVSLETVCPHAACAA